MYEAIIQLCEGNIALIATILALNTAYGAFKTTVAAIVSAGVMLETPLAGVTKSKKTTKKVLAKLASLVAASVSAYAVDIDDEVLEGEMQISESFIFNSSGMKPVELAQLIYDRANVNPAALLDYGITSSILSTLLNLIQEYTGKEPQPKVRIDNKKGMRIAMKGMFVDADRLLKRKLDKLMLSFAESNEEFYEAYKALRIPLKPAVSHTVVRVQVLNVANDKPIRYARVYHDLIETPKRTSVKGFVTYKNPAEGNHTFYVKHKLFKDSAVQTIMVTYGEKVTVVVKLEAV